MKTYIKQIKTIDGSFKIIVDEFIGKLFSWGICINDKIGIKWKSQKVNSIQLKEALTSFINTKKNVIIDYGSVNFFILEVVDTAHRNFEEKNCETCKFYSNINIDFSQPVKSKSRYFHQCLKGDDSDKMIKEDNKCIDWEEFEFKN